MGEKEKSLPYSGIPINNYRKNDKNRKSPFDKHNHISGKNSNGC